MSYDFTEFKDVEIIGVNLNDLSLEQVSVLYTQAKYCQAMCDADIETLKDIVPEHITFTHMSGRTQSRDEYFKDIEFGNLDYYSIGIENPIIEISEHSASITYTSVLNANAYGARGTYRIKGTHRFIKENDKWISSK